MDEARTKESTMLQLWETGETLTRFLEATTWSYIVPTYKEGEAKLSAC